MAPRKGAPLHNEQVAATKKQMFCDALADGFTVANAAYVTGNVLRTVYRWRDEDPEFAEAWAIAYAAGAETLHSEALRRAVTGVEKPLFHMGHAIRDPETGAPVVLREYSDTLLIFLMKARDPFRYCDRARTLMIERQFKKIDDAGAGSDIVPDDAIIDMIDGLAARKVLEAPR